MASASGEATFEGAGRQFAADLRAIREASGESPHDLCEATKIPLDLIEAFEETALFDHALFNRVYLRSFVHTYASAIGVDPADALGALDAALDGRYQDRLRLIYIEGEMPKAEVEASRRERDAEDTEQRHTGAESGERQEPPPSGEDTEAPPAWTDRSPPGGASRSHRPDRDVHRRSLSAMTWGIAIVGLLAIGGLLLIVVGSPGSEIDASVEAPAASSGALQPAAAADATPPPPAEVELGEMMDLTVVAADGPVRALRITRDSDLRRPYWIEEDSATVFPAEERIIVENPLDGRNEFQDINLLLEGYPYPTGQRDTQGRIVITRSTAHAFLHTLRGAPVRLAAAPDTNYIPASE